MKIPITTRIEKDAIFAFAQVFGTAAGFFIVASSMFYNPAISTIEQATNSLSPSNLILVKQINNSEILNFTSKYYASIIEQTNIAKQAINLSTNLAQVGHVLLFIAIVFAMLGLLYPYLFEKG